MIKKERYIGTGIDQDTAPDKRKADVYWDAENIRIINNGRSLSIKPIHGSEILIPANLFPDNLNGFCVVGNSEINSNLYLFITNNTGTIDAPNPSPCKNYLIEVTPEGVVSVILSNSSGALNTEYNIPGIYSLTIPEGVTSITVGCYGAGATGMHGSSASGRGGAGGSYAESTLSVTPGQIYTIIVADETLPSSLPDVSVAGNPSAFSFGITDLVKAFGGNADGSSTGDDNIGDIIFNSPSVISGNGSNAGGPIGGLQGTGGAGGDGEAIIDGSAGTYTGGGGGRGVEDIYSPGIYGTGGVGASGAVVISMISTSVSTEGFKLSCQNELDVVANYENEDIIKLYWTDGVQNLKSINVLNPSTNISIIEKTDLLPAQTALVTGGNVKPGNVQYTYSLFNINGAQSIIAPLSRMISVSKPSEGFESTQDTGLSIQLSISVTTNYEYIRIYRVHFLEKDQTPEIRLIVEDKFGSSYSFVDAGNEGISSSSEFELVSIGGRDLVVNTMAVKRNRLFVANYKINNFNPDIDTRAFGHELNSINYRVKNADGSDSAIRTDFSTLIPGKEHDCINFDQIVYGRMKSTSYFGVTGPNVQIRFKAISMTGELARFNYPSLKQGETYRFGIVFYNNYGQPSPAKWVCDYKIPYAEWKESYWPLMTLTSAGQTLATSLGCTKYQIVMVERKEWDRSVISQGFLVPGVRYSDPPATLYDNYYRPYHNVKDLYNVTDAGLVIGTAYTDGKDWHDTDLFYPTEYSEVMFFYSSDTIFENIVDSGTFIVCRGTAKQIDTNNYTLLEQIVGGESTKVKLYNSLQLTGYNPDFSESPTHYLHVITQTGDTKTFKASFFRNYNELDLLSGDTDTYEKVTLSNPSTFLKKEESLSLNSNTRVASNVLDAEDILKDSISGTASLYNKYSGCIALEFSAADWHYLDADWGRFGLLTGPDNIRRIPIVDLCRTLTGQYGGNTYTSKQRNEYLVNGSVRELSFSDVSFDLVDYIGDIYKGPLCVNRVDSENLLKDRTYNIYEHIKITDIENNHNIFCRSDSEYQWINNPNPSINYGLYRIDDNHKLLSAYNQSPNFRKALSVPAFYNEVNMFNSVVQSSAEKFPNEVIDSWLKFPVNENRYLEGVYGSISKLYNFKGEIIVFQENAICLLSINPRIQTQAVDGVNIELGIGAVLYDHKYITTVAGCVDKNTVIDDGTSLFYYDRKTNTINVVEQDKLSTALSVREIMEQHPNQLISAAYHRNTDEVLFVFDNFSMVYNSLIKKFIAKYTHETPVVKKHINFGNKLLFLKPGDGFMEKYASNDVLPSSITYMMCPFPSFEKVFHNLEYRLVGDNFDKLEVTSPYGASGELDLVSYNKFGVYRTHLPRKEMSIERFREIYIFVKLIHEGILDYALDDVTVMFDVKG
jgi:hypothetical protein